jgi:general secretion pathway protein A
MYESFFGLAIKPFELVPNPRFLFLSKSHKKALNYLEYGIQERAGFILLTGEVGSGKTTIIRDIVKNLDDSVALSLVFNTRVNGEQLIALINEDFGLSVTGKGKVELLRDLNDFLVARHAESIRPILIVDEAQNLSKDALEEIRLLSNLEAENCKLIQIILVGQPELKKIIASPDLRQLRQRISIFCHLEPLNREETEEYVFHRLAKAGNRHALNWQEGTFDALYGYSGGIPRLINVFCDFVLLAAFVEETHDLTLDLVEEVIGDVTWERSVSSEGLLQTPAFNSQPRSVDDIEDIVRRLNQLEAKLSRLRAVQPGKKPFSEQLAAQENILKELAQKQEADSRRLNEGLKLIAEALEEIKKSSQKTEKTESQKPVDIMAPRVQAKKGVLRRIFG